LWGTTEKRLIAGKKKPEQTPHQVISHPTSKWDGKNSPNYIISGHRQLICPSQFVPIPGTKQEVSTPQFVKNVKKFSAGDHFFHNISHQPAQLFPSI
jgi:hypothetical protein